MTTTASNLDIAAAWHARAGELADWATARLANRLDAYGEYRPEEEIGREYQRRDGTTGKLGAQQTIKRRLTRDRLVRHFQARARSDVLGLHTADADNRSKGGALDIDHHGPDS